MPVKSVAVPWRVGVCRGGLALGVRRSLVELNKLSEIGPLRIWRLFGLYERHKRPETSSQKSFKSEKKSSKLSLSVVSNPKMEKWN